MLAEIAFREGRYIDAATAAESAAEASRLLELSKPGLEQMAVIARLLGSGEPTYLTQATRQRVLISYDNAGLPTAPLLVNGVLETAVIDTGANLSVASTSAAKLLGLSSLTGEASVSSSTQHSIGVNVAVADTITFAGHTLRNVRFIVIPDEALTFPELGGYKIDVILGFPELRQMRSLTMSRSGWLEVGGQAGATKERMPALFSGNGMHLIAALGDLPVALLLDSGANKTELRASLQQAEQLGSPSDADAVIGGAGGHATHQVVLIENRELTVGPLREGVEEIIVDPQLTGDDLVGKLGIDILRKAESWTVDFVDPGINIDTGK